MFLVYLDHTNVYHVALLCFLIEVRSQCLGLVENSSREEPLNNWGVTVIIVARADCGID